MRVFDENSENVKTSNQITFLLFIHLFLKHKKNQLKESIPK